MAKKSQAKRKPKRRTGDLRSATFLWLKRAGIIAVLFLVFVWGGLWFLLSGTDKQLSRWSERQIVEVSSSLGFKVKEILVEGRENTDPDILLGVINVMEGDPIFSINPREAKVQMEKISWIKSARVERRLPHTVFIKINERKPVALWHFNDVLSVVDEDGVRLDVADVEQFKTLPMVRGKGADQRAHNFIRLLEAEPVFLEQLDHAHFIDERRWDLHLKSGKQIKLPENDVALALRTLAEKNKERSLLSEEIIVMIDARQPSRLIVKTKRGKAQDYESLRMDSGTAL